MDRTRATFGTECFLALRTEVQLDLNTAMKPVCPSHPIRRLVWRLLLLLIGLPAVAQTPTTIIVDNSSGGSQISTTGNWISASDTPGYWGFDYRHDGNVFKGSKVFRFIPYVTLPGSYEVSIRYPSAANRASNVPVEVVHATGSKTYTVNQRVNGGSWVRLGVHSFKTGSAGAIVIRTTGTDGFVCADAVQLELTALPVVTVVASDSSAVEPIDPSQAWDYGTFTLTRSGLTDLPLTVSYSLVGTARERSDFNTIGSSVTFAVGSSTATVTIKPVADVEPEKPNEFVNLTVVETPGYKIGTPFGATVTIDDNDWGPFLTVDNADGVGRVVPIGTWSRSTTTPGYQGPDYWHDQNAGKGTKSAAFYPYVSQQGKHEVFIRHTAAVNRASNVPVDIFYAGGMKTVLVNQRINHGTWVSLGTYPFDVGSYGKIVVRTTGTDGYVIVDAVRLVAVPDTDVTVSHLGLGASEPSTADTFVFSRTGDLQNPLKVLFQLEGSASPGVDYRHPGDSITIPAGASTALLTVTPIDDIEMESTEHITVTLSSGPGYYVSFPGEATMNLNDNDPTMYLKIDNADGPMRVIKSSGWTASTASPGFWGSDYLHDQNSGKGTKSVEYIPTVPSAGWYNVYVHYTSAANRASNVPVEIRHGNGTSTVGVNQRINGGKWVRIGTYWFLNGIGSRVIIRNTGTDGYVIADGVLLDHTSAPALASNLTKPNPLQLSIDPSHGVIVTFDGDPGVEYFLETSTNLVDWRRAASGVGTGPGTRLVDRQGGQAEHRFYRTLRINASPEAGISEETASR
jgi:hypothetical protein